MDNQTIIAQAPLSEAPHLALSEVALVNFQAALDRCLNNWNCGEGTVILQDNIPKLFGEFMFNFFKRTLLDALGEGSDLTIMVGDDGTYTRIEMSKIAPPLPQFDLPPQPPQTSSSDQSALDSAAVAAGLKKVSRPMNCWVIYRDATSKKLKLLHPDLTVQEISTICSSMWRNMSAADKKHWQAAAQSAKEEHMRQYPDYKYSPRKPGQKKKRQPRKAKQAAAVAAGPEILNFQLVSTTASSDTDTGAVVDFNTTMADAGNTFNVDLFAGGNDMVGFLSQGPVVDLYDAESVRHERLTAEFGNFNVDLFAGGNDIVDFLLQGPVVDLYDAESVRHERLTAEFGNSEFDTCLGS